MTSSTWLLDTHVWFWLVTGNVSKLRKAAVTRLENAAVQAPLWVSVISVWEIALLEAKGRLAVSLPIGDWIRRSLDRPEFRLVDIGIEAAIDGCALPGPFHADPADRFLVATARTKGAPIVTHDARIIAYARAGYVKVVPV